MSSNSFPDSPCILSRELSADSSPLHYIGNPKARCAGAPPDDPLQRYALCLDCDLLHEQGDRSLFGRLSECLSVVQVASSDYLASSDSGYAAIRKMLERLSLGDPDARVVLPGGSDAFRTLEPLLNRMAEFMKGQIEDSHEVAIGLCEHYDTLLKLAGGDLACRASTASPIELIAKLGELINCQADAVCETIGRLQDKEQELVSLNRLQRDIINFLPDATFVIDRDHRVIAWNKAMVDLSGVAESEILGEGNFAYSIAFYGEKRPLLIDLIDADPETTQRYYSAIERRGSTLIAEGRSIFNGSVRDLWITASPLFDQSGQVIGAIESVRDVSAFKKAESERELLKDQLHHAQKLDSIGQLAGGIAHEFNNILAAIIGYAGLLELRLGSDSPQISAVHHIISASEKAATLTRSMLTFSRKQIVLLEPIPLNSVIAGMRDMLCRLAGEDIRMNILLNPQELVLNADRGQLQQVLLNLYNNARDAMPGGGCLTIATSSRTVPDKELNVPPEVPPGRYILLTVSDTGCGIPAEDLKRIFDPFFTTKEVGKGTGLGLSMVFGIVQQHEGHITVDSTPGLGTVFSVWFPEYDVKDGRDSEHATALGGV